MRLIPCLLGVLAASLGCGTPPNQRILTRASTYEHSFSLVTPTGYPVDIADLERRARGVADGRF